VRIYRIKLDGRSERRARDECLRVMVQELIDQFGVDRMVVCSGCLTSSPGQ
jgi:predicted TIM-barrel fold metal-dependent hydrolase